MSAIIHYRHSNPSRIANGESATVYSTQWVATKEQRVLPLTTYI